MPPSFESQRFAWSQIDRRIDRRQLGALLSGCARRPTYVENRQFLGKTGAIWRRRQESNPPGPVRSRNGFEDREGHQPPFASARMLPTSEGIEEGRGG